MEERLNLIHEMRSVVERAESEKRGLNSEEKSKLDQLEARIKEIDDLAQFRNKISGYNDLAAEVVNKRVDSAARATNKSDNEVRNELRSAALAIFRGEVRSLAAMSAGTATAGGNAVLGDMLKAVIEKRRDLNDFRKYVRVVNTASNPFRVPVQGTQTTAGIVAEAGTVGDSLTQPTINQASIEIYKLGHNLLVSNELLEDSEFNIEEFLIAEVARGMAAKEEALIVAGTGSSQQTGFAVPTSISSVAIGTTELSGTGTLSSDNIVAIFHGLNQHYRKNAIWSMNDSTLKLIRLLKDGNNQYLWQPGLQAGQPDMLLGRPVVTSASHPEMGADAIAISFMDPSFLILAERRALEFKILSELYAGTDQIGLYTTERFGFEPVLAEAISRGVCPSS